MKLSRAAYYRRGSCRIKQDAEVIAALNAVVTVHSRRGFWKWFDRLRIQGHGFNHKRVHRVYCAMKLNLPSRTKHRIPTRIKQPLQPPLAHNRIWASDFSCTMRWWVAVPCAPSMSASEVSPCASLPPGNSHAPARCLPGGRCAISIWPSWDSKAPATTCMVGFNAPDMI